MHGSSDEVLRTRVRELGRFLERVAQHPLLRTSDIFLFFLRASIEDIEKRRADAPKPQKESWLSVIPRAFSKQPEDADDWFVTAQERTWATRALLQTMGQTCVHIQQKWLELSVHYLEHEGHVRTFAEQTQSNDTATHAFTALAGACRRTTERMEDFMAAFRAGFYNDICDYQRQLDAVDEMLAERDRITDEEMRAAVSRTARAELIRLKEQRRKDIAAMVSAYAHIQKKLSTALANCWADAAENIHKAK